MESGLTFPFPFKIPPQAKPNPINKKKKPNSYGPKNDRVIEEPRNDKSSRGGRPSKVLTVRGPIILHASRAVNIYGPRKHGRQTPSLTGIHSLPSVPPRSFYRRTRRNTPPNSPPPPFTILLPRSPVAVFFSNNPTTKPPFPGQQIMISRYKSPHSSLSLSFSANLSIHYSSSGCNKSKQCLYCCFEPVYRN